MSSDIISKLFSMNANWALNSTLLLMTSLFYIHFVSIKNIYDITHDNLKKNQAMLKIYGINIWDTTCHQKIL